MTLKKLGKALLYPPVWVMALLSLFSAMALTAVFLKGWETAPAAYGVYVLSFYTLCVVTVYAVTVLPGQYRRLHRRLQDNPLGNRYLTDKAFRSRVSLYLSLGINLLYVGLNLLSWYRSRSWWFVVLAVYYVIMACMRYLLVRYVRRAKPGESTLGEWKRARLCAGILLLVNLSLSGAILMILYQGKGYDYPGMGIYVMAMYTFYSTIHATVEIVRHRTLGSPVLSMAKVVSLSGALVSMLNLETAMFSQFGGEMSPEDQRLMIILTGAGISVTVVTLSVLMMVRATREIRGERNGTT